MKNRIETFGSTAQLAEAGKFLLDNPFGPDAVVVDGFEALMGQPWIEVTQGDPEGYAQNRERLYELMPAFAELDAEVAKWDAKQVNPVHIEPGIGFLYLRNGGCGYHHDAASRVGLGLSIRIDNSSNSREMLLRRPEAIQTPDGLKYKEVSDKTPHSQVTRILQKPGQAVIFTHFPRRTLHKVITSGAQALIAGYNGNREDTEVTPVIPQGNYSRPIIKL